MRVEPGALAGLLVIEPETHRDERGWLSESWHAERYGALGLPTTFAQDNLVLSEPGVLRGLHLQHPTSQGKLVQVLEGEVLDVSVDLRVGSPTFGRWTAVSLSASPARQVWVPPGCAHGYAVVGAARALVHYRCSAPYRPREEIVLSWDDPTLAIPWPLTTPSLSPKDAAGERLAEIDPARLPRWTARAGPRR